MGTKSDWRDRNNLSLLFCQKYEKRKSKDFQDITTNDKGHFFSVLLTGYGIATTCNGAIIILFRTNVCYQ